MTPRMLTPWWVLVLLLCTAVNAAATSDGAIVLRNITIVDVERGRLEARRDVVIFGDRIVGVQTGGTARAPRRGRVLDGSGKFLIPGLWDFHVHVFSAPGEENFALPLYIANGVTGVRDAGALRTLTDQKRIAQAIERGERVGPRLVLAGALIDGPPGSWPGQMVATTPSEGRARVREAQAAGWSTIKSYSLLAEDTYLAIADEARRRRLPLFGHIPESVLLETAVRAGHRSIEHFGRVTQACATTETTMIAANAAALRASEPMSALMKTMAGHNKTTFDHWDNAQCARVTRLLAQHGTAVMPSLMVSDFYLGKDPAPDDPRMLTVPQAVRAQWQQGDWRRQQMSAEMLEQGPRSVALDWRTFKLAHDAGAMMLAGTDAAFANPFLFHGHSLHDELARYVQAGLTPQQALMTATLNPGRYLKQRGLAARITWGQKADLVLLDANPLDDIAATRRIHAVVANGRMFDRAALDAMLADLKERAAR